VLRRYMDSWERRDVGGLASLLKEDAHVTMPPIPTWYLGREAIAGFFANHVFAPNRGEFRQLPTRANRQPAFRLYRREPGERVLTPRVLEVRTSSGLKEEPDWPTRLKACRARPGGRLDGRAGASRRRPPGAGRGPHASYRALTGRSDPSPSRRREKEREGKRAPARCGARRPARPTGTDTGLSAHDTRGSRAHVLAIQEANIFCLGRRARARRWRRVRPLAGSGVRLHVTECEHDVPSDSHANHLAERKARSPLRECIERCNAPSLCCSTAGTAPWVRTG
jgi:hypothetical protein